MANIRITYQEMEQAASQLGAGREDILGRLQQLQQRIQELVTTGFVTDTSSHRFEAVYAEYTASASQMIDRLSELQQFITQAAAAHREMDAPDRVAYRVRQVDVSQTLTLDDSVLDAATRKVVRACVELDDHRFVRPGWLPSMTGIGGTVSRVFEGFELACLALTDSGRSAALALADVMSKSAEIDALITDSLPSGYLIDPEKP